ncbi:hypothetical protein Kirov_275 [Bacillus phage Kirov]|uniref:Uncharacterized protein n=1 Tax=Bacillus phage Kirov TaxID=2783539 RepID=A0A7S6RBH4_9CAUD|nr:hypothetical protein PQE67_gp029 [Bacillus phage Kirov]QOV08474.1 hypothetical protein Kirov_275 [Bacillus phage Kirov]
MKTFIDSLEVCQESNLLETIILGQKEQKEENEKSQVKSVSSKSYIANDNMNDYTSDYMNVINRIIESNMDIFNNSDIAYSELQERFILDNGIMIMGNTNIEKTEYSQKLNMQLLIMGNSNKRKKDNWIYGLLERLLERIYYRKGNIIHNSYIRNRNKKDIKILQSIVSKKDYGIYAIWNIDINIGYIEYSISEYNRIMNNEYRDCMLYQHMDNRIMECNNNNICNIVNIESLNILRYSNIHNVLYDNDNDIVIDTI